MSADLTGVKSGFERGVFRGGFGIRFHCQALHGLQSRSYCFLIRLGPPNFRIETLIDFTQSRIMRPNAGNVFGIRRGGRTGWFAGFIVSISIHKSVC
jgi:hypothetical protein